jgi:hypothetical protein
MISTALWSSFDAAPTTSNRVSSAGLAASTTRKRL